MLCRWAAIWTILSCLNLESSVDALSSTGSRSSISSSQWSLQSKSTPRRALISSNANKQVKTRLLMSVSAGDSKKTTPKKKYPKKKNYNNNNNNNNFPFTKELGQAKAINKELINASTAQEILDIFISKGGAKGSAGGDTFNSVNFSTCLHRLARFANQHDNYNKGNSNNSNNSNNKNGKQMTVDEKRRLVLSDPRTAILIASLSEALVAPSSNKALIFNNREFANLGWAIAKLKVAPPSDIYPIVRSVELMNASKKAGQNEGPEVLLSKLEDMNNDIVVTAKKVREQVLEVAIERSTLKTVAERAAVKNKWIPALSQLSGKLLDLIATQVLDIVHDFNSQELANLLYAFASAGRSDHILFEALSEQLVKSMEDKSKLGVEDKRKRPKPQEFSNSVWAFASAGLRGEGQIRLVDGVADILDHNDGAIVQDFKPQELSNTAWGVATLLGKRDSAPLPIYKTEDEAALRILRWVAKALVERADDFKSQEISNTIWAFATVGFGAAATSIQSNTNNDYLHLKSDQEKEDRELISKALGAVADSAMKRLPRFRPQELNNLSWGICRLGQYGQKTDVLFAGIGQELMKRHQYFKPQDIGTTLWSFATYEFFDADVYRAAASELTLRKSHSFKPQELSNTVWALATAGAIPQYADAFDTTIIPKDKRPSLSAVTKDPITECFAAATKELMRRPASFKAQEIKDVLWSLSRAGIRHPGVFKSVAEHLVGSDEDAAGQKGRGMDNFSPQGLGNLAWAYAKQAQLAAGVNESTIGSTGRLAVYETSCLDVGENLVRRLFSRIAETGVENLHRYKPQDLSNTCWAFATLGLLHNSFFNAVSTEVILRQSPSKPTTPAAGARFKAQEIANLVWSFATLNCKANGMINSLAPCILQMCSSGNGSYTEESIARCIKRQEVANLAWSCAVSEEYPKELMPLLYTALFGKDCQGDPVQLKRIYGDDGIQKQAIMSMFYVQMGLQLESPDLGLSLPENFPNGWQEIDNTAKTRKNKDETNAPTLQLTTSKLQQKISRTFHDIGFDHILEHTITTHELGSDYGLSLNAENQELLSLDIANLNDLIGVEVDGPGHFVNILDGEGYEDVTYTGGGAMKTGKGTTGWEFTANGQQQANGPTALKHRLMNRLGWKIVHIPYFDWRDEEDKKDYCKRLINDL